MIIHELFALWQTFIHPLSKSYMYPSAIIRLVVYHVIVCKASKKALKCCEKINHPTFIFPRPKCAEVDWPRSRDPNPGAEP